MIGWPATVLMKGSEGWKSSGTVLVPTMKADEPKETEVPDAVMAGAPGVNVVPAAEMPCDSG